jgi:hypothetical protein
MYNSSNCSHNVEKFARKIQPMNCRTSAVKGKKRRIFPLWIKQPEYIPSTTKNICEYYYTISEKAKCSISFSTATQALMFTVHSRVKFSHKSLFPP